MQLTEKEMIDLWLLSKGYEPLRTDATIIRTDGVDIRAIARLECRRWYHRRHSSLAMARMSTPSVRIMVASVRSGS